MQYFKIQKYIHSFKQAYKNVSYNNVDLLETFDCVVPSTLGSPQTLWNPSEIITIILKLYNRFTCQAIHWETLTEPFPVTTGVGQG